jgi:hypothetical protein
MVSSPQQLQLIPENEARAVAHNVDLLVKRPVEDLPLNTIFWPQTEASALAGFQVDESQAKVIEQFRSTLEHFRQPNAVWMDTTTLYRARRLLADDPEAVHGVFDPLALIDLDTFIRNFILYDQVVYGIHNVHDSWTDMRPVNEQIHDPVFVSLLGDIRDVPAEAENLFNRMFTHSRAWLDDAVMKKRPGEQFSAWRDDVRDVFGVVPDTRAVDRIVYGWGSDPSQFVWEADHGGIVRPSEADQQSLIGDATVRCIFNSNLSKALGLPYHPAAARIPTAARFAAGRAATAADTLLLLLGGAGRQIGGRRHYY